VANFELIHFPNADELASRVARLWLDEIESANRAGKRHCVALSGGRIAQKFFASVVAQNQTCKISFDDVHFFWADERCVPPTNPESNFKMANELLLAPLKISEKRIHRLRGELSGAEAVKIAEAELRQFVPAENNFPILDIIFLGMGEDGHVASLFPNATQEVLNCLVPFLGIQNSPKPPSERISLSYAAIKAAKVAWVLASGDGKEAALRESLKPGGKTPLARIIDLRAKTKIFSDIGLD
jgi:6-phosphogluconolactonase